MSVNIDVRSIRSHQAAEIYISVTPVKKSPAQELWREIFAAVRKVLLEKNAFIIQERIFGTAEALKIAPAARSEIYGSIDDGVPPAYLVCKELQLGQIGGVQVYACVSNAKPQIVSFKEVSCGRILKLTDRSFLALSAIEGISSLNPLQQAKTMMENAESILKQFGADFLSVPRTWMWLSDILSWYGDFNNVRNRFFNERGIITQDNCLSLPASTGIGLAPLSGSSCAMDLLAVIAPAGSIQYLPGAGRQNCPIQYGSAFSRAAVSITPAGKTAFVSGTACIDAEGKTAHIDDPEGQVNETIENVRFVLKDIHCSDEAVVSAVAYCKTTEVENVFNKLQRNLPWPIVIAICDICRHDLLFELEATAKIP